MVRDEQGRDVAASMLVDMHWLAALCGQPGARKQACSQPQAAEQVPDGLKARHSD